MNLLVLIHNIIKSKVRADRVYNDILESFILPSAGKLYGDAHAAKHTNSWFKPHYGSAQDAS